MTLKTLIFDLDGTLIDSRSVIQLSAEKAFVEMKLPPPDYEETRQIVGLSLYEAMSQLAPSDLTDEQVMALGQSFKNYFIRACQEGHSPPLYTGIFDLLLRLRKKECLMAIATGKSRAGLRAVLKAHRLINFFDVCLCGDDGPSKPAPFMVEEIIKKLGSDKESTLLIGDASHDIIMAQSAQIKAFGVSWGFHTKDELVLSGADQVFDNLIELSQALDLFLKQNQ